MRPVLHADCPRAQLRRPVSTFCEVVRESDFRLVGSRILDLSTRGLLVESDLPVLTGDEVLVSLRSPTTKRWYDCTGTVVFSQLMLCEDLRHLPVATRHKQFAAFPNAR